MANDLVWQLDEFADVTPSVRVAMDRAWDSFMAVTDGLSWDEREEIWDSFDNEQSL